MFVLFHVNVCRTAVKESDEFAVKMSDLQAEICVILSSKIDEHEGCVCQWLVSYLWEREREREEEEKRGGGRDANNDTYSNDLLHVF